MVNKKSGAFTIAGEKFETITNFISLDIQSTSF